MTLPSILSLGAFLVIVLAVASTGILFKPGTWYNGLAKPSWTPPNLTFPIVWTVLYVLIAVSGWRVYEAVGLAPLPFAIFALQLVLNAAWSWLFFGLRRPDLAFADILALGAAILANIAMFAPIDAVAAWLLVPYLAWVCLAAGLNRSVWRRNPEAFAAG